MASDKSKLLKVKATLKRRTPKFLRQDSHKRSMKPGWRAPKGLHSKIGDNRRGYRKGLKAGYQSPAAVRGMNKHGLYPTLVETIAQLDTFDPKTHTLIVSGTLGGRKKLLVIEAAKTKGFTFTNANDKTVALIKEKFAVKSKRREARLVKSKEREATMHKASSKKEKADVKSEEKKEEKHSAPAHHHQAAAHDHEHERQKKTE
jgi:large subunit ribosomal protein L32e